MKFTYRLICTAMLVGAIQHGANAQDGDPSKSATSPTVDVLEPLSTLEIIRASNPSLPSLPNGAEAGMGGAMMGESMVSSGRQLLLQQINQIRQMLGAPDQDRTEVELLLREALSEYFVADMQERVREFDKIKARVVQMESKLQTRLDRRHEVVELQIKQMLHKADGLDFFVPEGASSGDRMQGNMSSGRMGEVGMGSGLPGGMSSGGMSSGGMAGGGMARGGMPGVESPEGSLNYEVPAVPGYDLGFGMTRFLRLRCKDLKPTDPLNLYLSLDANTDRTNELAKLKPGISDEEKLKYMLLAMYNFESIFHHFPSSSTRRTRMEQPHSWRVALLPILGHAELYKQYRFDEPWDSESNIKFIAKMPAIFGSKDDQDLKSGKTRFQMLVGNGAAFDPSRPTEIRDITDGTSNTIALVQAASSVPWTKPEDLQFVPGATLSRLGEARLVGMCDGSVRSMLSVREPAFTMYATRAGGEVIPE